MHGNWVSQTTTTTGTGNLTLSSVSGFPTFANVFPVGKRFRYAILTDSAGLPLEEGIGYLSDSTTLVRERPSATFNGATYDNSAPSALNLSAGTYRVICTGTAGSLASSMPAVQGSFGSKVVLPEGLSMGNNSRSLAANEPVGSCLYWDCEKEVVQLACDVTVAGGTGSDRIQIGVYDLKADGTPGDLLMRTGDIAVNSTGFKTAALAGGDSFLPPGWYWWVICSSVNATVRGCNAGGPSNVLRATPMGHVASNINTRIGFCKMVSIAGGWTALPSNVTLSSGVNISADFPPTLGAVVA